MSKLGEKYATRGTAHSPPPPPSSDAMSDGEQLLLCVSCEFPFMDPAGRGPGGCSREIAFHSEASLAEVSELRREPCEAGGRRAVISGFSQLRS